LVASYDLLPGNGVLTTLVEREGMNKRRKMGEANKERKKVKKAKDADVNGHGRKKAGKGGTQPITHSHSSARVL